MSVPYHRGYRPPFPQLRVVLRAANGRLGPFAALLDSGADATLVPTGWLLQVGAAEGEATRISSHFGEYRDAQFCMVDIQVNDMTFPGIYVVGDDVGNEIILGRDVLNKLALFLDGPEQRTEVLDDATVKRLHTRTS